MSNKQTDAIATLAHDDAVDIAEMVTTLSEREACERAPAPVKRRWEPPMWVIAAIQVAFERGCRKAVLPAIRRQILELMAAANTAPGQTPAIECIVMFKNGHTVRGSLSTTPSGVLRMLSPGEDQHRPILVEQFFDYDVISAVALTREMTAESRRIVVSSS